MKDVELIKDMYGETIDTINKLIDNKSDSKTLSYHTGMAAAFRIALLTLGVKKL